MKIFFGWLLVSLGSTFLSTLAVADTIYDCTLSEPLALDKDGTVFLEQVKNTEANEYTMRLTYTAGLSWMGIGINQEGKSKMAPASAVIGRADTVAADDDDVQFYQMTSDSDDGSGVIPVASNLLHDVMFTQDDATQTSVLQFTHSLTEMNVNDDSMWIFAVGLPDNAWEGKHKVHGSFQLALTEGCVARPVATSAPVTPQPTNQPTNQPTTKAPTPKPTTPQEQPETTTTAAPTFPTTSAPTFVDETEASLTAPTSSPSTTSPTASDIVQPNTVVNINLPSTSNDNVSNDTATEATSTTTTSSQAQSQTQTQSQPQIQFFDTTQPNKSLWIAHGIVLSIAWGICAPLGIGASILRHPLTAKLGAGKWYQIHFYANVLTTLLTIVGFALAVVATSREGDAHFSGSVHHKAGLAIFILVVVQSLAGYLRPGMPAASRSVTTKAANGPSTTFKDVEEDSHDSHPTQDAKTLPPTPTKSLSLEPSDDAAAQEATSIKKPLLRKFWEVSHRLMGAVVVGLAWYNCHSGIGLQEENWPSTYNYTNLFWGVTAGISGMIFLVAYVVRMED